MLNDAVFRRRVQLAQIMLPKFENLVVRRQADPGFMDELASASDVLYFSAFDVIKRMLPLTEPVERDYIADVLIELYMRKHHLTFDSFFPVDYRDYDDSDADADADDQE